MTRIGPAVALGASVALMVSLTATAAQASPNNNTVRKLTAAVTADGVHEHLVALQEIADTYGDRAAGRPGYEASVDYVVEQLMAAGYSPEVQPFTFTYFEEASELIRVSPNPRTFVDGVDFLRNQFDSGIPEGTGTGALVPVDLVLNPAGEPNSSSSGCDIFGVGAQLVSTHGRTTKHLQDHRRLLQSRLRSLRHKASVDLQFILEGLLNN